MLLGSGDSDHKDQIRRPKRWIEINVAFRSIVKGPQAFLKTKVKVWVADYSLLYYTILSDLKNTPY